MGALVHPLALARICLLCCQMEGTQFQALARALFDFLPPIALTREVESLSQADLPISHRFWLVVHFLGALLHRVFFGWDSEGVQPLVVLIFVEILLLDIGAKRMNAIQ